MFLGSHPRPSNQKAGPERSQVSGSVRRFTPICFTWTCMSLWLAMPSQLKWNVAPVSHFFLGGGVRPIHIMATRYDIQQPDYQWSPNYVRDNILQSTPDSPLSLVGGATVAKRLCCSYTEAHTV